MSAVDTVQEVAGAETPAKVAYVYRLGESGIWKVGKTTDLERREKAFGTISTEQLVLYAAIDTTDHTEVENFIKARLQSYRWLEGAGKDLYRAERGVVDAVVEAARRFSAETLPQLNEAEKLSQVRSDRRVLTPSEIHRQLHHELLEARQAELRARQEMRRIRAELMLVMGTASHLDGIATFESQTRASFDGKRFQLENPTLAQPYMKQIHTRPFCPRW
jgi:hypothetical protein